MQTIRKKGFKRFIKKNYEGWLFASLLAFGLIAFTAVPVVQSLVYSFFNYDGVWTMDFVGLGNYAEIFTADREYYKVVGNTVLYAAISIPISLVASYALALAVNQRLKGIGAFRALYYMPCMIPAVVSGLLWKDMFEPTFGIFNKLLTSVGLPPSQFFNAAGSSMMSVILMNMWGIGGGMILWLSALKNIPEEMYEAAKLDGAGAVKRLFYITIPMSTSMIFYNLVMMLIGTLQSNATMTFAARGGRGVEDSLYFYGLKVYMDAFTRYRLGYASALAWVLLLVIGLLTAVMFKTNKWVYYGEES